MATDKQVNDYAVLFTRKFYIDMKHKPSYRGTNFSWDKFPNIVAKLCRASLFMNFSEDEQPTEQQKQLAADTSRKTAQLLLEDK